MASEVPPAPRRSRHRKTSSDSDENSCPETSPEGLNVLKTSYVCINNHEYLYIYYIYIYIFFFIYTINE